MASTARRRYGVVHGGCPSLLGLGPGQHRIRDQCRTGTDAQALQSRASVRPGPNPTQPFSRHHVHTRRAGSSASRHQFSARETGPDPRATGKEHSVPGREDAPSWASPVQIPRF